VKHDALDLYKANLALQRRTRIETRRRRVRLLEDMLAALPPCSAHRKMWEFEIAKCQAEIEAEGSDDVR
jgi:hypothetical protein